MYAHSSRGAADNVNIGLDHFARPDDELVRAQQNKTLWRNFQGYTTHKDRDILAFADALASLPPLADDGLVIIAPDKISVTPSGRLFLGNIGMCFDRYLKESTSKQPRYSRTA